MAKRRSVRALPFLFLLLATLVSAGCASFGGGGRVERGSLWSEKIGRREAFYVVLLPPGYEPGGERRYPVLYWLHDGFGDERSLVTRGVADLRWHGAFRRS